MVQNVIGVGLRRAGFPQTEGEGQMGRGRWSFVDIVGMTGGMGRMVCGYLEVRLIQMCGCLQFNGMGVVRWFVSGREGLKGML